MPGWILRSFPYSFFFVPDFISELDFFLYSELDFFRDFAHLLALLLCAWTVFSNMTYRNDYHRLIALASKELLPFSPYRNYRPSRCPVRTLLQPDRDALPLSPHQYRHAVSHHICASSSHSRFSYLIYRSRLEPFAVVAILQFLLRLF